MEVLVSHNRDPPQDPPPHLFSELHILKDLRESISGVSLASEASENGGTRPPGWFLQKRQQSPENKMVNFLSAQKRRQLYGKKRDEGSQSVFGRGVESGCS
jgi:hypothetical protein